MAGRVPGLKQLGLKQLGLAWCLGSGFWVHCSSSYGVSSPMNSRELCTIMPTGCHAAVCHVAIQCHIRLLAWSIRQMLTSLYGKP